MKELVRGPESSKTCTFVMAVGSKFDYWAAVLVGGTFPTHDYYLLSSQKLVCSRLRVILPPPLLSFGPN
jgi:hypothetical protein